MDTEEVKPYSDTLDDFDAWLKGLIDCQGLFTPDVLSVLQAVRYKYHQTINSYETYKSEIQSKLSQL